MRNLFGPKRRQRLDRIGKVPFSSEYSDKNVTVIPVSCRKFLIRERTRRRARDLSLKQGQMQKD